MVLFKYLFFTLVFLGAVSSDAASLFESLPQKAQQKWLQLLHFHKGESRIDSLDFFVHPEGHQNAAAELSQFISLFEKNSQQTFGRLKLSLACAYPARIQFLEDQQLIQKKTHNCEDWQNWQREVNPNALSVVFSTAYPNNPGSMFGHTFLRFHNQKKVNDLLDYGANYAALTDESDIGIVYAFKGIFGGYRGFFDLAPYYVKVNEYNHGENRDLIEYELNLSPEKVKFLLAHLWELYQGASFDYFFTYENCSFHLNDFINVALEEPLDVPSRWYYLPADLIHALVAHKGNLIKEVRQRPSQMRKVKKLMGSLSAKEEAAVKEALQTQKTDDLNPKGRRVLAGLLDLEKFKKKEMFERSTFLANNLKEMAKSRVRFEKLEYNSFSNKPDHAHQAQKATLGVGNRGEEALVLGYQSGYHELLARDEGLEPFSQFRFLGLRVSYLADSKKLKLEELNLIDVVSLHPWRWYHSQLSWRVGVWAEDTLENLECRNCQRLVASGKVGLSFGDSTWITSLLFGAREELTDSATHLLSYEAIFGINVGGLNVGGLNVGSLKTLVSFEGRHNLDKIKSLMTNVVNLGINYSWKRDWELRFNWQSAYVGNSYELAGERGSLDLGYYF